MIKWKSGHMGKMVDGWWVDGQMDGWIQTDRKILEEEQVCWKWEVGERETIQGLS